MLVLRGHRKSFRWRYFAIVKLKRKVDSVWEERINPCTPLNQFQVLTMQRVKKKAAVYTIEILFFLSLHDWKDTASVAFYAWTYTAPLVTCVSVIRWETAFTSLCKSYSRVWETPCSSWHLAILQCCMHRSRVPVPRCTYINERKVFLHNMNFTAISCRRGHLLVFADCFFLTKKAKFASIYINIIFPMASYWDSLCRQHWIFSTPECWGSVPDTGCFSSMNEMKIFIEKNVFVQRTV